MLKKSIQNEVNGGIDKFWIDQVSSQATITEEKEDKQVINKK